VTLRLFLDEDVSPLLASLLRDDGFDVLTTMDAGRAHQRMPDEDQLAYAASLGRAICTHNIRHYSPLAVRWAELGREHAGIILAHQLPPGELAARFRALVSRYPDGMTNVCDFL
jgi:hypothetical protein